MSERDGNYEIYVMGVDGRNIRNLTNNNASDAVPAWSPNASQIAFMSDRDGNEEIYVMDADGDNVRRLTNNPLMDSDPAWGLSPPSL
jgi:Tol biopolymer transport system component